jgi:dTDP-4-dehydrorhamnose reductase
VVVVRWLVTGASGMLGQDLVALLRAEGDDVVAAGRSELDVTDPAAVERAVAGHDVVVNCAAYTAVDAAEGDEPAAFTVNAVAPALLARAARSAGARMVHISTDYVFDGAATSPYPEDAAIAPRSAYGRTKAAGEWAVRAEADDHLVVRTAWLYGAGGPCFPKTIARVAAERGGLDVVDDQVGQPTWTADLASLVVRLVRAGAPAGTYHGTSSGAVSWHGFAQSVVASAGLDPAVVRTTTSEKFVRPAPRPAYSVLGHDALVAAGVDPIGPWDERWQAAAGDVLAG